MTINLTKINTFTKEDIIFYLDNYISLMIASMKNPECDFKKLNRNIMKHKYGQQFMNDSIYYNTIMIYKFLLLKQIYSYKYDAVYDDLKEEKIKNINLPNNIFVNPNDENKFSKKQIIKFIRNAINHNDTDRELYHIVQSENKLLLDIHLLNTKPIPFHVQISIEDFINLEKIMIGSEYNPDMTVTLHKTRINYKNPNFYEELNKIVIRRYNFEKNTKNVLSTVKSLLVNGRIDKNKLSEITTSAYDYKDYELSISQKTKIEQDIDVLCTKFKIQLNDKILGYLVNNVTQFGSSKLYGLWLDFLFCDYYLGKDKMCLLDFQKDVINYANGIDLKNNYLNNKINDISNFDFMLYRAWDWDQLFINSYNILLTYLFDTYIQSNQININEKIIDKEKIRNSLVHGRFYIGGFNKYKFFDSQNGRKNESNINWQETIKLEDLLLFTNSIIKNINYSNTINIPIRLFKDPVEYLCFTLNSDRYICLLKDYSNLQKYKIYKMTKDNICEVNDEEKIIFLEQINLLSDLIKNKYEKELDEMIAFNRTNLKTSAVKLK